MGCARPGQFIAPWRCTWQGHGVHVCWGIGCVLRSRGWLAMSTRQVFVVVCASVRAGALDGVVGQRRDAIVGGWFCIANRGDDNLKNISVVMARVFVGVWGSCGVNHNKKSEGVITSLKNPHLTGHG